MMSRRSVLVVLSGVLCLSQLLWSQQPASTAAHIADSCAVAGASAAVSMHAPKGPLNLCDGHALSGGGSSPGKPVALASVDLDEDGVPDLISGYASGNGGTLQIHRGNIAALWPYGRNAAQGTPSSFLPNPRTIHTPETPDFILTGDFDADGHQDLIVGQRGSSSMYLYSGDGHGGLKAAKAIPVGGSLTAMISGEINKADGLADVVVGVTTGDGSSVLVYESPQGAAKAQPEIFPLHEPATSLALGHFDGTPLHDLAIGTGTDLVVVHARDRKLSSGAENMTAVPAAKMTVQRLGYHIQALTTGDFTGAGPSLAALGDDGSVHVLEHSISQSSTLAQANAASTIGVRSSKDGTLQAFGANVAPSVSSRVSALHASAQASDSSPEWTEKSTIAMPASFAQSTPKMIAGRVSGSRQEDLLVPDSGNAMLHVLSVPKSLSGSNASKTSRTTRTAAGLAVSQPMKLSASIQADNAPSAVLPMRLNQHGLNGLVVLQEGQNSPTVMPELIPAANIFTVTNTSDITAVGQTAPAGSMRAAMQAVGAASGANPDQAYEIAFNIPTTDPGYNPATGTFRIQPISENVPGSFDEFALPPINATVTIDGYTQPGASPNTLAVGDNAKILIEINGALATTPGGSGLVPFDDNGSTYRGLLFTGWSNPEISGGTASGASGIEANGVGDFIEGNFFGTDPTGTRATNSSGVSYGNRIGIFADNGPLFGSAPGTIVGGTTPQARNILSNNQIGGILYLSIAYESLLEGNYIGVDATGALPLGNGDDGVGSNGPTITIGGTLPGDGNVISANANNVDFNDITNGGAASGSFAQGNLIGTDPTGTVKVSAGTGTGVSITSGANAETIGGTTSTARNIISGNYYGVYIFDSANSNIVQGNYIGTDITGTQALGNAHQGFLQGASSSSAVPAILTVLGGSTPGAGNVISGNGADGVSISGTADGGPYSTPQGSTILGNFIGTDKTGQSSIPNGATGVSLLAGASNNTLGGSSSGSANVISHNASHGVLIDVAGGSNSGSGNVTIANTILSNGGAGVRVNSGTGNRISQNSIYQNGALGIDIGAAGPNTNLPCGSTTTGANNLTNYPVLTAGTGATWYSATATDSNGNTSEFSQAVQAATSGAINLLGAFVGAANATYTIEFFANQQEDSSTYGQGQTYLGSTTVTTGSNCSAPVSDPINTNDADMSISLTGPYELQVGPDFGNQVYTANVQNLGPATATNVVVTDTLPAGVQVSSLYCNVGACQSPITTNLGTCTVSGTTIQTITCTLGTMVAGETAAINIPVQASIPGTLINTATVTATQVDPVLSNNSATSSKTSVYPEPFIYYGTGSNPQPMVVPSAVVAGAPDTLLTVYGNGFVSSTVVSFNGVNLPTVTFADNQICGYFQTDYCQAISVVVPAAQLATAGTPTLTVTNPDPGPNGANTPSSISYNIVSSCQFTVSPFFDTDIESDGTPLIPEEVTVAANAPSCSWTASSTASWAVPLESTTQTGQYTSLDFAIAPNTTSSSRSGSVTIAGTTFSFSEDPSSPCSFTLTPGSSNFTDAGGSGSVAITSVGGTSCVPFINSYASWITFPDNVAVLVGEGNPAPFTVAPNTGAARTGNVMIGGDVFTVTQSGPSCTYTVNPATALWGIAGGSGTFAVTASSPSCTWQAAPSNAALVSVTSGASGTGNGTVHYTVPSNNAGPQTPSILVTDTTGASTTFAISQASAYSCTFAASPATVHVSADGTSNFFELTASNSFCQYTTTSNNADAVSVKGGATGTGTSTIFYAVGQNTSTSARTLTVTAGCITFTVQQDGTGVINPVPTLTALSPSGTTVNAATFTLTVTGTNFVNGSVVNFNGTALTTSYVSATQLTATVPSGALTTTGTVPVTVTNPAPGGGTSNALSFTIVAAANPVPTLTALQPSSVAAGSAAFTLTVTGTNFIASSVINFNGAALTTTYVSATQLTAQVPASDIASTGTASITVVNPSPGGGASSPLTLTINAANNPAPTLTALQPSSATAGAAAFTLTVTGTNFIASSVVNFNGATLTTTYVSATQLTAAVPATAVASAGTPAVTVTNPSPGGGTSNALTFTVNAAVVTNPVPTLTALQPSSVTAGAAAFTLTVTGTNFIASSVVNFNGAALTTTYVSATQLTAAVPATAIASAGTPAVTVVNPSPGGGTSSALTFTVNAVVVNNPVPTLTVLQPTSVAVGSGAFTLTVTGTNFLSSSIVNFNGTALTTTYVSATHLTAAVPAADTASATNASITVTNPSPGGGTSSALSLAITATPTFTLSNSGAQTAAPGASVQFTITATAMNGSFPNAVALSASGLPAGATATFNPASITPGATSATATLTITAPATLAAVHVSREWSLAFLGIPLWILMRWRRSRRRLMSITLALLVSAVSAGVLSGCGNSGFSYSTSTSRTYSITITGTSGSISTTNTVQLTVNYPNH